MNDKNNFLKSMDFRHACKAFDETKKISDEDINFIMEVARKSPSSFGQEAWKFLVITNEELKAKLRPFCWDQVQITSCSHLVVVLSAIDSVKVASGVPRKRFERRELGEEMTNTYLGVYKDHLTKTKTLDNDENIYSWTTRQTYIAAANMMTAAASIEIDSCPIEGLDKENVEKVLELDTTKYQVSMMLPFGYRMNPQSKQLRVPFDEVIEFIK